MLENWQYNECEMDLFQKVYWLPFMWKLSCILHVIHQRYKIASGVLLKLDALSKLWKAETEHHHYSRSGRSRSCASCHRHVQPKLMHVLTDLHYVEQLWLLC